MCGTDVYSSSLIRIFPHLLVFTPILSRFKKLVTGSLPIANNTVSNNYGSPVGLFTLSLKWTLI